MKKYIIILLSLVLGTYSSFSQNWLTGFDQNKEFNFNALKSQFDEYWKDKKPYKGSGYKQYKRIEWLLQPRLWKTNSIPDLASVYSDYKKNFKNISSSQLQNADWKPLGPNLKPTANQFYPPPGLGRISCMEFSPDNQNIIYAGSATGGIWKTTNSGTNWTSLDLSSIMSIGISDISIPAVNPQVVYAGTGDAEASGFLGTNFSYSIGVLKSTNAGQTWSVTNLAYQISEKVLVNRVLSHPANAELVYAATSKGLFKSINGGTTWDKLTDEFCREIKFQPDNPSIIYCAFKLSNGGYSIKKYTEGGGFLSLLDIPDAGRVTLATNTKNPLTLYALACTSYPYYAFHSVWKTTDGYTWQKVADKGTSSNYLSFYFNGIGMEGQGFYDLSLETNPNNPDEVYLGGVNIWKSTNGAKAFTCIAEWTGSAGLPWVHADIHMLKFNKNGILYACTDGGINKTTNNGTQWTDISNGMGITQFYSIASYPNSEYLITGGSQDNGTHYFDGSSWKNIFGGDGMITLIDYSNPQIIYSSLYNGTINKSTNGGLTFKEIISSDLTGEEGEWVTPYILHPSDPNIIYVAMQNVWKSTDGGNKWVKISDFKETQPLKIQSMAISPSNPNYIYISKYNNIYKTTMGGGTWTLVGTMSEFVTSLLVSPTTPTRFWATQSGYSASNKVGFYDGTKWSNISDGLPNVPVNCIEYQKNSQDRLYIGTDVGVFTRDNSNPTWESFNNGMPNVIINSLNVHYSSGKLRAGTYGRGLWETKVIECNISQPEINVTGNLSFCDGDSIKLEVKNTYSTYLWSTGAKTRSIWVKAQGTYYVTVTDANNCSAKSSNINVVVTQTPDFTIKNITAKDIICDNSFAELTVSSYAYKYYKWSNGDSTKKISVFIPGTYWVECETADGCKKKSTNQIVISTVPAPAKPSIQQQDDYLISTDAESYQWFLNDTRIDGETGKQIKPKSSGNYKVEIFAVNECSSISDNFNFTLSSILEFESDLIQISPNPGEGIFNLKLNKNDLGKISFSVFDLTGRLIKSVSDLNAKDSFTLDLSGFENGIYLLNLKFDNKTSIYKIVKI